MREVRPSPESSQNRTLLKADSDFEAKFFLRLSDMTRQKLKRKKVRNMPKKCPPFPRPHPAPVVVRR